VPLVFVHGVNNRRGDTPEEQAVFDNRAALIREQFRNVAFASRVKAQDGLAVFTPYWGDLGVKFARNLACVPKSGVQELAVGEPEALPLFEAVTANLGPEVLLSPNLQAAPLVTVAQVRSLEAAVDLLFAGGANAPLPGLVAGLIDAIPDAARFAAAATEYASANSKPAWLTTVLDDQSFLDRLLVEVATHATSAGLPTTVGTVTPVQSLSVGSTLKSWLENGANSVQRAVTVVVENSKGAITGTATSAAREAFLRLSTVARPGVSAVFSRFFGDVFTYLENRQAITSRVVNDIQRAIDAKRPHDDELYLVGHSFGGIILYDILTTIRFEPALKCDLYVTIGSQVALFAEIGRLADQQNIDKAFKKSSKAVVPRPLAANRWLNIFDPTDFFGFGTRGVFGGALDYLFETDALPLVSHGAYFDTPRFFVRLRERVQQVFETGTDAT
jgi:hypothetical protein